MPLKFVDIENSSNKSVVAGGVVIAELGTDVSGFYYAWFTVDATRGALPEEALRAIADKLADLNADYWAGINEYFDGGDE